MLKKTHSLLILICTAATSFPLLAQVHSLTLARLIEPSSVLRNQGEVVPFALNGFIEFENLEGMFTYVNDQAGRWNFSSPAERKAFADDLFRRGVESRIVSMIYEDPHEVLMTHTPEQLAEAVTGIHTSSSPLIYRGRSWSLDAATYRDVLVQLQERWKGSLNCWSSSASVPERVLSNWYIIPEGITLFGASYDSTEHFWQAVKYHPEVQLKDLLRILDRVGAVSWKPWLETLATDQKNYFAHTYSVEFLQQNLTRGRLEFFKAEVTKYARTLDMSVRVLQQRSVTEPWQLRFTALQEKILWGDLADVFHLLYYFAHLDGGRFTEPGLEPVLEALKEHHFDNIYLTGYAGGKVGFISPEFRQLMLEIWRVKFLDMKRFRDVIRSTQGFRLLHFLNDGDSPDIPIPIYVGMLEQIRELALQ